MTDDTELQLASAGERTDKPTLLCGARTIEIVITSRPYTGQTAPPPGFKRVMTTRYQLGRFLMYIAMHLTCGCRVAGAENVPAVGPAIIVCNHQSLLDPPFIALVMKHRQVCFMAKQELRRIPFIGWLLEGCRCVWVDRKARDGKALQGAFRILEMNDLLGVFPEGTRSKDGKLLPAHSGAATLALRTGAAVIPAAVYNTMEIMNAKLPWGHGPAGIRFGSPIVFEREEEPSRERIRDVKNEMMWRISELLKQGMP